MRTIAGSLAWKEIREHLGDLLATTGVTLAIPLFYAVREPSAVSSAIEVTLVFYPLLAGIFLGMRAAVGERTRRTAAFLCSLPVRPWSLGVAKLLAAGVTVLLPLLLTIAFGLLVSRFADQQTTLGASNWWAYVASALGSVAVMLVVAVFGAGARSEVPAATRGIVALVCLWSGGMFALALAGRYIVAHRASFEVLSTGLLAVAVVVLAATFVAGYARAIRPLGERRKGWIEFHGWTPLRLRSPLAALAWKDAREICAAGVPVLAVSLLLCAVSGSAAQWLGGFVMALLIGVGSLGAELQPAVNTFWRSRPISASMWYWSKFTLGLAAILLTIGLSALVTRAFTNLSNPAEQEFLSSLLICLVAFSLATTLTCLIRQSVQAGILAAGLTAMLYVSVQACYGTLAPWEPGAPLGVLAAVFASAFVASTLLGWWAAARDLAIASAG